MQEEHTQETRGQHEHSATLFHNETMQPGGSLIEACLETRESELCERARKRVSEVGSTREGRYLYSGNHAKEIEFLSYIAVYTRRTCLTPNNRVGVCGHKTQCTNITLARTWSLSLAPSCCRSCHPMARHRPVLRRAEASESPACGLKPSSLLLEGSVLLRKLQGLLLLAAAKGAVCTG